jgi:hypothetical protein
MLLSSSEAGAAQALPAFGGHSSLYIWIHWGPMLITALSEGLDVSRILCWTPGFVSGHAFRRAVGDG